MIQTDRLGSIARGLAARESSGPQSANFDAPNAVSPSPGSLAAKEPAARPAAVTPTAPRVKRVPSPLPPQPRGSRSLPCVFALGIPQCYTCEPFTFRSPLSNVRATFSAPTDRTNSTARAALWAQVSAAHRRLTKSRLVAVTTMGGLNDSRRPRSRWKAQLRIPGR